MCIQSNPMDYVSIFSTPFKAMQASLQQRQQQNSQRVLRNRQQNNRKQDEEEEDDDENANNNNDMTTMTDTAKNVKQYTDKRSGMTISDTTDTNTSPQQRNAPPPSSSESDTQKSNSVDNDFKLKARLPTPEQIKNAFEKLTDFTLVKILPPNLQNPLDGLETTLRKQLDAVNINLEKNVKMLFSSTSDSTRDDLANIQTALMAMVSKTDDLLTLERKKAEREQAAQKSMSRIKRPILRFYPHLLQLIKALLAYNEMYHENVALQCNEPSGFIYRAWMDVLGYLKSIQSVIVYAAKEGLLDLDSYPLDFEDVINHTESEKMYLKQDIYKQEDNIASLKDKLQEEKKRIKDISDQYKGLNQQVASGSVQLAILKGHLESLTNPGKLAKANIQELEKMHANTD